MYSFHAVLVRLYDIRYFVHLFVCSRIVGIRRTKTNKIHNVSLGVEDVTLCRADPLERANKLRSRSSSVIHFNQIVCQHIQFECNALAQFKCGLCVSYVRLCVSFGMHWMVQRDIMNRLIVPEEC